MKIAHISDLHIRNYKYYDDYIITLDNLFTDLNNINPDLIVFTGDTFHTKIHISGEAVSLAKKFFGGLSKIAPTKVLLGNHDLNVNNINRISPVIPIVNMFENTELYLNSGVYNPSKDINFIVYSLLDEDNFYVGPLNQNQVNIGLAHYCINGALGENNYTFSGKKSYELFKDLDFVLLGDIHRQQFLDENKKMGYAGSLIQQNFGEGTEKGYLLWDVKSKNDFTVSFRQIESPIKFFTVNLTPDGSVPANFNPPEQAKIRIIIKNDISPQKFIEAKGLIEEKFCPKDIKIVNLFSPKNNNLNLFNNNITVDNIRSIAVQEELIRKYFEHKDIDAPVLDKLLQINREIDADLQTDNLTRNVVWSPVKYEFDNYFNYGNGNFVDFAKLRDKLVLVAGPNACGKSALIDALCHTAFNATQRKEQRNATYINRKRNSARGRLVVDVGGKQFSIHRRLARDIETNASKTSLDFNALVCDTWVPQNSEQRTDTDKIIRDILGSSEDTFLSSISSQHDLMSFITAGATRRKELIMKFLDLSLFDDKFDCVRDLSKGLKLKIKDGEKIDFDGIVKNCDNKHTILLKLLAEKKKNVNQLLQDKTAAERELAQIELKLKDVDTVTDINGLNTKLNKTREDIEKNKTNLEKQEDNIKVLRNKLSQIKQKLEQTNKQYVCEQQKKYIELASQLQDLEKKKLSKNELTQQLTINSKLIFSVPCEGKDKYSSCPLIANALQSRENLDQILEDIDSIDLEMIDIQGLLRQLDECNILSQYDDILKNEDAQKELNQNINQKLLAVQKIKNDLLKLEIVESDCLSVIDRYNQNIAQELENIELLKRKDELNKTRKTIQKDLQTKNAEVDSVNKDLGIISATKVSAENKKEEYLSSLKDYEAYSLLMDCFGKNGIPYNIMKEKLPIINNMINSLVDDVVPLKFELLQDDNNNLDVGLIAEDGERGPISSASGMEKTIASIAIRAALCLVSNLSRSSVFVIDEGFGSLDPDYVENIFALLHRLKSYFTSILIITHVDALKDAADMVIYIGTDKDGFAHVEV